MKKIAVYMMLTLLVASSLPLNVSADSSQDIPANAAATGVHDSLVAALTHAGLVATLQGTGPFTVFAPTDQAFADAGIDLADFDTPEENATLSDILLHHVYSGTVNSSDLTDGMLIPMVNGDNVKFGVSATTVTVGTATVETPDVQASNGVIHIIDTVLIPPVDIPATAQTTGIHDSLVAAVIQADLLATLQGTGPFTLFAPTDQAFADAGIDLALLDNPTGKETLSDILLYHVVPSQVPASAVTDCMSADAANGQPLSFTVGNGVMVNDANVTMTDVVTSNGLIHVIDKVLTPSDTPNNIPRTAQCTGIHDSLVAGVIQAELLETLQGPGPFTVFAPTDQAFADAGIDLASLDTPAGKAALSDILLYHVVSGEVPSSAVTECMSATAVNGQPLSFTVNGGVMVNGANVTLADVNTSNGVIHVIDKVLTPSDAPNDIARTAQCTGIHDSLVAAVVQADLLETLQGTGPFTLFAPTDQAFADAGIDLASLDTPEGKTALANILLYHVVSGEVPSSAVTECLSAPTVNGNPISFTVGDSVMVNDATVTLADVNTSNGVIHVIDKVLSPTETPRDIPRTAQCTGIHDSLVASVIQAGLLPTLQSDGPFTVFAPTDQAFIDAGIVLADLDTEEGKAVLSDILLYHVLSGEVPAANVTDCMSAPTVNGNPLSFTVGDSVMVNGATVVTADVATSNGVIHVIDKVLTPTSTPNDIPRTAQCTGIHNSLVAAVIQAELLGTLQGDGPFTLFAPTDQAFADAGIDLASLDTPEGKTALTDILLYHVVPSAVPASAVTECMTANAVNGQPLAFTVGTGVMVNGANVTLADVNTSNGIIHVIDKVLTPTSTPNDLPRTAQCTGIHNSLVAAVIQAELLETLQGDGPFTLFAPTDQAFADAGIDLASLDTPEGKTALANILLYHVVPSAVPASAVTECMTANAVNGQPLAFTVGTGVMVNGANVTLADVNTSNGVIHVIDKVLSPSDTPNDLPRTAQCTGIHNSLVAAVIQAELLETLQGDGPFTLFAPTDQAFADAGIDLTTLDTPEGKAALTDILLYHVHAGSVQASNITEGMMLQMVNGDNTTLSLTTGINGANITLADVMTSNGIIHVIDAVLMPPEDVVEDTSGDTVASEDDDSSLTTIISLIAVGLVGALGAVLFLRSRGSDEETQKDLSELGIINNSQPIAATSYATQQVQQPAATVDYSAQYAQQAQPAQQVATQAYVAQPVQSVQPIQTVEVIPHPVAAQPVVAEPTVVRQWTDEGGYTWRSMDDGNTYWWTGTEWKLYG
tara:strand:+ start:751 stop:4584 length:3834 start_codon:yes stop_codon:yes gene_type:complete